MKEAFLYDKIDNNEVNCRLCSHFCNIKPGRTGLCGVRLNDNGTLFSLVYGKLIARSIDPIEKKPLFHFLPGSKSYSIATVGCNLFCKHCQNADISQLPKEGQNIAGQDFSPEQVVEDARNHFCASISYTYTEPTIFGEYVLDTGILARQAGIKNILVTNGYQSPDSVKLLCEVADGANIDLKSFNNDFYKKVCKAELQPVLDNIKAFKTEGVWVEITTLLIPGLNDSPEEIKSLARFLADEVGTDTPWHISRFHPTYKMTDRPPTPMESLTRTYETGLEAGLKYVYMGNVPGRGGEDTICPGCGKTVIKRTGFSIHKNELEQGRCPHCSTEINGIFF